MSLPLLPQIILGVHDKAKDKPCEVELGWLTAANGWKYSQVPKEQVAAAVATAQASIEADELGDVDEMDAPEAAQA